MSKFHISFHTASEAWTSGYMAALTDTENGGLDSNSPVAKAIKDIQDLDKDSANIRIAVMTEVIEEFSQCAYNLMQVVNKERKHLEDALNMVLKGEMTPEKAGDLMHEMVKRKESEKEAVIRDFVARGGRGRPRHRTPVPN